MTFKKNVLSRGQPLIKIPFIYSHIPIYFFGGGANRLSAHKTATWP